MPVTRNIDLKKILIANRGEVAVRISRAVRDLGLACTVVYSQDDAGSPHVEVGDDAVALATSGPAAYLDIGALIGAAGKTVCDAVHPGYGFLSERAEFAEACNEAGLIFIGPTPGHLRLLGDKSAARSLAAQCGVPLLPGSIGAVTLEAAVAFMASQGGAPVMLKAVQGGGGRGMRAVQRGDELEQAYARCVSEARSAFGVGEVYIERLMPNARHIEVQVAGDGEQVVSFGERDCSLQRRFQKLAEIAPSPRLAPALRQRLTDAALTMARQVGYRSLGTFEFLVDGDADADADADAGAGHADVGSRQAALPFVFMEANPRLQVEHTVTEEVTGVDLVQLQIRIAAGARLGDLGFDAGRPVPMRGFALQWRLSAESTNERGETRPASGRITRVDLPSGPGVRVDTHGRVGFAPSPQHDGLLAKLIVSTRGGDWAELVRRARRCLSEARVDGIATNLDLLRAIAARPEFESQALDTLFVQRTLGELLAGAEALARAKQERQGGPVANSTSGASAPSATAGGDNRSDAKGAPPEQPGLSAIRSPMPARVVEINVDVGRLVPRGAQLLVIEAMKMQHLVTAADAGRVVDLRVAVGDFVDEGALLLRLSTEANEDEGPTSEATIDPETIRPDLQRVIDRHAFGLDANRPEAVAKRHAQGGRTARENIEALCDPGSFIEYGALAVAAQTRRRTMDDLIRRTPADGMVTGLGTVNAEHFGPEASRCAVMAYDYTVLAGTQGSRNHQKTDRLLGIAHRLERPVVLFAEGGGGRPGDTDMPKVAGLNNHTFSQFAALSGKVPVVGIVHGRCFAGNAALLGCADVVIATVASNIGMGGPAMIEGGGIGTFAPEAIGPSAVQSRNGVIDLLVADEAEAVREARRYLGFFQGCLTFWQCDDQRLLRRAVPENRLRVYDVRSVLDGLFDKGSVLELRRGFGLGAITALARIDGRPVGVMANNPGHLGGAIDVDAADKFARFMQLCNAHGLPIVSLTDTPGFMVGPDIEARAQVRHCCRMFVVAAHLTVPFFAVVLRKGYGLGAQAMTAGGFDAPVFTIAWPSGEFGAMGLEGAVRLGFRRELEATDDADARETLFRKLVDQQFENGSAINMAATLEIDAVIDPADTRAWLLRGLMSAALQRRAETRRMVDAW